MPIYAYKCDSCGFAKDVLQKLSEAPLALCPSCGVASFKKQLTAAGFLLKGSGWYATDFKDSGKKPAPTSGEDKPDAAGDSRTEGTTEAKTESKSDAQNEGKSQGKGDSKSDSKGDSKGDSKTETKKADAPVVKKPDATPAAGSGA